ncbi:NucA/NucB deoxyribonuclease domain-containing protein [Streptomyces huasconensis]|uniref:NucA/NucB deoxyribonuclease domain-containing protein n=1 Tax=Streptomyces huasconensis TaxID=1854574 RepID=UPI0036FBC866
MTFRTTLRLARGTAATAALAMLVVASPAVAQPDAAGHAGNGERVFVDASTVPAAELAGLNTPQSLADYTRHHSTRLAPQRPATAPDPGDPADLRKQCAERAEKAKGAKGWIKSRFESCQKRPYDLILRDKQGTQSIGRLWFDQWILGFAYDGSRRVDYVSSVENIRVQAPPDEDATKWRVGQHFSHTINAGSSDPDPAVTAPQTTRRDELLGAWDRTPQWTLTYTSPDKGAVDPKNQQRVNTLVMMDLTADSPNASPYSEVNSYHSNVRFDYAGQTAGKHKGTVFTEARVELTMSRKDPLVKESALHIYDAQKRPERTFPSFVGKSVPGEKEPLHRLVDKKKQEDNREKSIKECAKVWGSYTGSGLECDEYPFASTKEGSMKGDNRFSVRLIDGKDNGKGGARINEMYTLNRVLDDDPFYVKITD